MGVSVSVVGLSRLQAALRNVSKKAPAKIAAVNAAMAPQLEQAIRSRAPVATGAYRASIMARATARGIEASSDAPQAARLEYGFVGVDSLGRHYAQSPQPHFRPGLEEFQAEYVAAISAAIGRMVTQ